MPKKGVLLVNLGSPDSFSIKDIKRYLKQFLMDKYVIDLPYLLRYALVHGIILNTRPPKTSKAYQKIWWDEGSPLIVITKRLTQKIQQQVSIPVVMAMRYGNPSIANGLQQLHDQGVDEVLLMPLYPQYAMATTQTIEVLTRQLIKKQFPKIKLIEFPAFFHRPKYISRSNSQALRTQSLRPPTVLLSRSTRTPFVQNYPYACPQKYIGRYHLL